MLEAQLRPNWTSQRETAGGEGLTVSPGPGIPCEKNRKSGEEEDERAKAGERWEKGNEVESAEQGGRKKEGVGSVVEVVDQCMGGTC